MTDVATTAVKDAYDALKKLMKDGYASIRFDSIEEKPTSPGRRTALAEDLAEAGVDRDAAILAKARELLDLMKASDLKGTGVSLKEVRAAALSIKNVDAAQTGVVISQTIVKGAIEIENVAAGRVARRKKAIRPGKTS